MNAQYSIFNVQFSTDLLNLMTLPAGMKKPAVTVSLLPVKLNGIYKL